MRRLRRRRGTGAKPRAPGSGRADLCARIGLVMMCLERMEERRGAAEYSYFALMRSCFQRIRDYQWRAARGSRITKAVFRSDGWELAVGERIREKEKNVPKIVPDCMSCRCRAMIMEPQ